RNHVASRRLLATHRSSRSRGRILGCGLGRSYVRREQARLNSFCGFQEAVARNDKNAYSAWEGQMNRTASNLQGSGPAEDMGVQPFALPDGPIITGSIATLPS